MPEAHTPYRLRILFCSKTGCSQVLDLQRSESRTRPNRHNSADLAVGKGHGRWLVRQSEWQKCHLYQRQEGRKKFDVRSRQNVSQEKKRAREETFPTGLLGSQVWQGIPYDTADLILPIPPFLTRPMAGGTPCTPRPLRSCNNQNSPTPWSCAAPPRGGAS